MNAKRVLITGATGFVGRALAIALWSTGHDVTALVRREDSDLKTLGIKLCVADLTGDLSPLSAALPGVDACFHTAAKVGTWGSYEDFYRTNVEGTQALVDLCTQHKVRNFIYTSSPSVIANGKHLRGVDESTPYPRHYEAAYPQTKALAEQLVLRAHQPGQFNTVALRPHLIFGPGDTNLAPAIVEKGRSGSLKQVGRGVNVSDFTFIEDCIVAHRKAYDALQADPSVGGRAYFISQGDPFPLWQFVNRVLTAHGVAPAKRHVSYTLARAVAAMCEFKSRLGSNRHEPRLTKFLVSEMGTDHYFSIKAAREKLGFVPRYTVEEGLAKTFGLAREAYNKEYGRDERASS